VRAILTSYQYCSKLHARAMRRMLNAPVFNIHTATELAGCQIGVECRHGRLHVYDDHVMLERGQWSTGRALRRCSASASGRCG
jgi:phenylacetate-coenzyme A ligase PaaK-like adenylate-forming protein